MRIFAYLMPIEARTLQLEKYMENVLRIDGVWGGLAVLIALWLVGGTTDSHAQSLNSAIPDNARARDHGTGWECLRGDRIQGAECIAVRGPANAFLGYSGDDWLCEAGYQKEQGECRTGAGR